MSLKHWTLIVIGVASLGTVAYDVYAAAVDVRATISRITIAFMRAHPLTQTIFVLWVGLLLGHLLWGQPVPPDSGAR
jgi:hypothetical protein